MKNIINEYDMFALNLFVGKFIIVFVVVDAFFLSNQNNEMGLESMPFIECVYDVFVIHIFHWLSAVHFFAIVCRSKVHSIVSITMK